MSKKKQEKRPEKPVLANQYRAIGPAAVAAALLHVNKKKKPVQKFIAPRHA
ncbi:hypothetical protein [Aquamicrobium ahrensii]|uniref:Transcriptional regulator n=1 Tax=Aquamicrobium ahrensii TaxID=469551 RepID=A0ABV2KKF3_9HYPH